MTAAPSTTDEVLVTALPPAETHECEACEVPTQTNYDIPCVIEATTLSAASLLTSLTTTLAPLDAKSWAYLRSGCKLRLT